MYSHPIWLVGMLVIGLWTGLSLGGMVIFHRIVPVHIREKDVDTIGFNYSMVAVIYAVLIAFIVVNVFEAASHGDEVATVEANELSSLLHDSAGLPVPVADAIRADLDKYIDLVVKTEWPSQQAGKLGDEVFEPGWTVIAHLSTRIASFEPATAGQNVNKGAMLHAVDALIKARRNRIEAAGDHLPDVVWQILLLSGAITIVFTYLFGANSFKIHLAVVALSAATIALVFVLIIALDYPFRGEVSVGDDAFVSVRATASGPSVAEPAKVQPGR
jgi:hypothetical protein